MTALLLLAAALLPLAACGALAVPAWCGARWSERVSAGVVTAAFAGSALAATLLLPAALRGPAGTAATWLRLDGLTLRGGLVDDALAAPFAVLAPALLALVSAFSRRYLHAEPGHRRFYLLLALFGGGVQTVFLAGTLETAIAGWELAGLASALLIGFFHERPAPPANGLRAFATYRLCDVGLLCALAWLHHAGTGTAFTGGAGRVATLPAPPGAAAAVVGAALLWAALGKSALFPLGGWLPRAMEGPTPSSAICYGALSVSLGPYLLLRTCAGWPGHAWLAAATVLVGLLTAAHATLVGRAQTDVKSSLAYASMAQLGLVVAEVGLGLHRLAVLHLVAHALLRSGQILRAPSLLHDHQHRERALGRPLPATGDHLARLVPPGAQRWLYRHALERGHLDGLLAARVLAPVARAVRAWDACEDRWAARLAGPPAPAAPRVHAGSGGTR
ncbi:hypothetical protein GCM10010124_12440 [Pilimelia terevasa]|uniref:NADH:quinone oxidoreductase/Mrp antiporter transmembrane domain-containing protein n=1 Tax=Pilimelia terevasa TaxID=53372 RepID=A0A8J3BMD0_9ACTN|nr:proton-conducting transporter membrane subunit [Pilimelia terevasa]GGK21488.1 hypothetical protein GCM10010124_12440 [Pilimelia terevasa]